MRTRWLPVLSVLLLSPVCAEYLSAYDVSAASLLTMAGGLVVLAPLYGAPRCSRARSPCDAGSAGRVCCC